MKDVWRQVPLFWLALAIPVSVSFGTIGVCLAYAAATVVIVRDRGRVVWPDRTILLAVGVLILVYFLATLLAMPYPHNWHKFGEELWLKLLLVAVPVLIGRDRKTAVRALQLAVLVGGVAAAFGIVQYLLGYDPIRDRELYIPHLDHAAVSGFFGHHLSYGGQILVFTVLAAAWYLDPERGSRHFLLALLTAIMLLALLWSFARSAWIGVLVGALALVIVQPGRRRWVLSAAGAAGLAVALALAPVRERILSTFDIGQHVGRLNLWRSSWDGLMENPLLGFGPGNFASLLDHHKVIGHFDSQAHAHNDLLMHGVNAGWPGLLAALALLIVTCWLMVRALRAGSGPAWIIQGVLAVQVGITAAGLFQVYQTDDEVEMLLYFVLGCAVALARPVETGRRETKGDA